MNIYSNFMRALGIEDDSALARELRKEVLDDLSSDFLSSLRGSLPDAEAVGVPDAAPVRPFASPTVLDLLRELGRDGAAVLEQWAGPISSWTPQQPVADVPLGAPPPRHVGAEVPLTTLFRPAILQAGLSWAVGPLQVMGARDEQGRIHSIRAAVGAFEGAAGSSAILLELSNRTGKSVALALSHEQPSMVKAEDDLFNDWSELAVRVYVDTEDR